MKHTPENVRIPPIYGSANSYYHSSGTFNCDESFPVFVYFLANLSPKVKQSTSRKPRPPYRSVGYIQNGRTVIGESSYQLLCVNKGF